jgi:hypothetical protein
MIPEFEKGAEKVNLDYDHSFVEFEHVLQGQYKTAWKQVIHKHFPEPTDPENVPVEQDCSSETNFVVPWTREEATGLAVHLYDARW